LRREVARHGITYIIVDSAGAACGNDPQRPETAISFFNALSALKLPSMTLAHVTKDQKNMDYPFGSVFWSNMARSTVLCQMELDDRDETVSHIGLFHKKSNNVRRARPIGLRMTILPGKDGSVTFEREDLGGVLDEQNTAAARVRRYLLQNGKATRDEITEETGIPSETVRKSLQRMRDAFYDGQRGSRDGHWMIVVRTEGTKDRGLYRDSTVSPVPRGTLQGTTGDMSPEEEGSTVPYWVESGAKA
jgi:hypothetical protein